MRTIIHSTLIFIFILSLSNTELLAQGRKDKLQKADLAFDALHYYEAIDLYKEAYKDKSIRRNKEKKAEIIFKVAECYRTIGDHKHAEMWYKKAIRVNYPNPLIYLYYGDMMKAQGEYEKAMVEYNKYKDLAPADPRGESSVKACQLAIKWIQNPTRYEVSNEAQLNSSDNEYAPCFADRKSRSLIFSSDRKGATGKEDELQTGQNFSDLFYTKLDRKGKWSKPVLLDETINTEHHEGAGKMADRNKELYFTRCHVEKKVRRGCQIFMAKKRGQSFDVPELLPIPNVTDSSNMGHPTVSDNGLVMYFSADLPGGQGGKDIWMIKRERKRGDWAAEPINLGPNINTAGNELFPFIHPDGTLYFSSDGHMGMGGLDIFKAEPIGDDPSKFGPAANMKYPINSSGDDFGIIFKEDEETGYFTSNRPGGKKGDDIYKFILPPLEFTLQGVVKDEKTLAIIPGATIMLVGTDGSNLETKTDEAGMYFFDKTQIKPNTSYRVTASHYNEKNEPDYLTQSKRTTTVDLEVNTDLELNFELTPIEKEVVIVLPEIRYDLGKWDLKEQYQDSLNGLIVIMNENPNIIIQLRSHTDYRGSDKSNEILAQKRAQSVVDYLVERGIDRERMKPKGMGEYEPREVDIPGTSFSIGDKLTQKFIDALPNDSLKEEAHQLNRRTDFKVIGTNYVPKNTPAPNTTDPGTGNNDANKEEE